MSTSSALSRFFSVPARHSGRVIVRVSRFGSVWAWRAPSGHQHPAPAALFFPAVSFDSARVYFYGATALGWRAELRRGPDCAVWASGPLAASAPPWACKVIPPAGLCSAAAQVALADAIGFEQCSCWAAASQGAAAAAPWY